MGYQARGIAVVVALVGVVISLFATLASVADTSFGRMTLDMLHVRLPPKLGQPTFEAEELRELREKVAAQDRMIATMRASIDRAPTEPGVPAASPSSAEIANLRADVDKFRSLVSDRPEDVLSNLQVRTDLAAVKTQIASLREDVKRASDSNATIGFAVAGLIVGILGILASMVMQRRQAKDGSQ